MGARTVKAPARKAPTVDAKAVKAAAKALAKTAAVSKRTAPKMARRGATAELTSDASGVQTAPERPIWEIVAEIGARISDEMWSAVPDDASINYRHYLYGVPKKHA